MMSFAPSPCSCFAYRSRSFMFNPFQNKHAILTTCSFGKPKTLPFNHVVLTKGKRTVLKEQHINDGTWNPLNVEVLLFKNGWFKIISFGTLYGFYFMILWLIRNFDTCEYLFCQASLRPTTSFYMSTLKKRYSIVGKPWKTSLQQIKSSSSNQCSQLILS